MKALKDLFTSSNSKTWSHVSFFKKWMNSSIAFSVNCLFSIVFGPNTCLICLYVSYLGQMMRIPQIINYSLFFPVWICYHDINQCTSIMCSVILIILCYILKSLYSNRHIKICFFLWTVLYKLLILVYTRIHQNSHPETYKYIL